jgi:hypothetical protein
MPPFRSAADRGDAAPFGNLTLMLMGTGPLFSAVIDKLPRPLS